MGVCLKQGFDHRAHETTCYIFNALMRVGPMMSSNNPEQAIFRFQKYVNLMAISGVLVLLLTAISQAN